MAIRLNHLFILVLLSHFYVCVSHPIKMTTAKVDFTNNTLTINFFRDDLTTCLTQVYRQHVDFENITENTKTILEAYIQKHFKISQKTALKISLITTTLENDVVHVTLSIEPIQKNIPFILHNTLLLHAFSNQRNNVIINATRYTFDINTTTLKIND